MEKHDADCPGATRKGDESVLRTQSAALRAQIQPEAGGAPAGFDWLGRIPLLHRFVLGVLDTARR
ncbi:MAG TPA: hypothetical protein VME63_05580 [Dyella sp.]|nr:hypothetical protein [Dyella sp.]